MKLVKILLCTVTAITISTCSSTAAADRPDKSAIKMDSKAESITELKSALKSALKTALKTESITELITAHPKIHGTVDDGIFVFREFNGDPGMLVPGNPFIDPEFLVKPESVVAVEKEQFNGKWFKIR